MTTYTVRYHMPQPNTTVSTVTGGGWTSVVEADSFEDATAKFYGLGIHPRPIIDTITMFP